MPDSPTVGLEPLHRDARLLVVNKPSGMLVHRGWARDRVVAVDLARELAGTRVWPLHRLDRGTSGVLAFALDLEAAQLLSAAFEAAATTLEAVDALPAARVRKRYLALCRGHAPEQLTIDYPLRRVDDRSAKHGPRLPARTELRRLAVFEGYSLVEAIPHTGRTHQIRRHLKHIAHPIIGDVRYGKGAHNRLFRARFGLHRLALHAFELVLPHPDAHPDAHPDDGQTLAITAPLPADLAEPLAAMDLGALASAHLAGYARPPSQEGAR